MQTKICSKCKIEKDICEFHKQKSNKSGYRASCKECRKIEKEKNSIYKKNNKDIISQKNKLWLENKPNYMKEYSKNYNVKNREKLNEKLKKWREKNKEETLKKQRKKRNEKYKNDLHFKLKHLLRCRINKIIKYKRNKSSIDILGCNIEYFISYIEKKFDENMSWDNYGYHGWHIDHVIPISSAKNEEDLVKLSHYTNLQPLWKEENLKKSNKLINN